MGNASDNKAVRVFEENARKYDEWFERNETLYRSELLALEQAVPADVEAVEVGVGTGRFAQPLNIGYGVEPSGAMAGIAEERGVIVHKGFAEELPYEDQRFDLVLMVTTVCFLSDLSRAFSEAYRVLRPKGSIVLGLIDKEGPLGQAYERKKEASEFYRDARFHSTQEITRELEKVGFRGFRYWQTLVPGNEGKVEEPTEGYGKGSFIVIKGTKERESDRCPLF